MFKAVVRRTRKDEITSAKLFEISQALKLWRVNDSNAQWVQLNVAMNRVIENLQHIPSAKFRNCFKLGF